VEQLQFPQIMADARAAFAQLGQVGGKRATFVVGFCRGGSLTILTGTQDFKLAGLISFYSGLSRQLPGSDSIVLDAGVRVKYPILSLFGGADQNIPLEQVRALDENLDKAGVEHEVVVYEGATHSFFDKRASEFAEASTDAWRRTLSFIEAHSADK
jgi:carboxymethylenebutenolidase